MRILGTKKRFAAVATTAAAVLVGGGIAVAYWTTTGSGTGTAPVGDSDTITYTVSATDGIDDLYPGASEDFEVDSNNPTAGTLQVAGVDVEITGTSDAGCLASWFSVSDIAGPIDLAAGTDVAGTVTIDMTNEIATNQDDCKNATIDLSFTSL
jgi:hypothetical protein